MKIIIKKYWWLAITVILLPKMIDILFCIKMPSFFAPITALYHLKASDILGYSSSVIVAIIAIASAFLALKQYKLLNRTYIVPTNKKLYFYADKSFAPCFLHDKSDIGIDEIKSLSVEKNEPIITTMKNIGKGTAADFEVIVEWNEGKAFYDLMSKLGYENYDGFRSTFEPDQYKDVGVFSSEESKDWVLPDRLKSMIRHICEAQLGNNLKGTNGSAVHNNCLIRQKYKLASIEIVTNDIMDVFNRKASFYYDLMIEIDNSMSPFTDNYLYSEVKITFNRAVKP